VLGMYGDKDRVVDPLQWEPLEKGVPHARIARFPTAGHFMMLESPVEFSQILRRFLDEPQPGL